MRYPCLSSLHLSATVTDTRSWPVFILLSIAFLLSIQATRTHAQADISTATLRGKVADQLGSAVAGATVVIVSNDRLVERRASSDDNGEYRLSILQPGSYTVRVDAPGFQTQVIKGVILTVGQIAVRNIALRISQLNEHLEVNADPSLVETERTHLSDTVERRQIEGLPNLSRNFTSYVFTLPGVADAGAARIQQSRAINISSSGFSVGAANGRNNYVSIDGGENDSGTGNLRIRNLSLEAVQEFQVNRNAYAAEYGFSTSTAINVVTRAGTNQYRGSGYVFYRSDKTSARSVMNTTGDKAFEQRLSPGLTFDGPLIKKRTFLFTSFEALKYDVARLRSYSNNASLSQPTAAQSAYLQNLVSGPNASELTRTIAQRLQSALATTSYPVTMQILRESEGQFVAPTRTWNWTTRIDHELCESDLVTARFTFAREDSDLLGTANVEAPSNGIIQKSDSFTAVGTWTHIFNDHLINQLRVQFAPDNYRQVSRAPDSTQLAVAGVITFGRLGTVPFVIDQKRYQFEDVLSWTTGSKDFKFGASYRPVDALMTTEIGFQGTFMFAAGLPLSRALFPTESAVLTGPLAPTADTTLTSLQALNLGLPMSWQQGFGTPTFRAWQHNFGSFAQVSWKPTPHLTLNLGARLNYDGEPRPMDRNISISPRVGFAWDPFGKGKTVIRGGFGTFYGPVSLNVILAATLLSDDGRYINSQTRTLQSGAQSSQAIWAYGQDLGKLPFGMLTEQDIRNFGIIPAPGENDRRLTAAADDYDNPYTVQASLGMSQQLNRDLLFEVGFQLYHGVHLPIALEGNYRESGQLVTVPGLPGSDLFGPRLERIDSSIAQKVVHSSEGNSMYYGIGASLLKRFGRGIQFRTSYTYSRAIDDVTDFNGGLTPYLPTRRHLERGRSSFDLRHSFVASGTFESPFEKRSGNNWMKRALADISLSPIVTLRTGFPFNLFIGRDVNGDLNTTDRPFYAPRNSGSGENFYSVDLRFVKSFYLRGNAEGPKVDFVAEVANLFNNVNYLRVNDVVCGTAAQPGFINGCDPKFLNGPFDVVGIPGVPATAPLGFVTAAPPRQFQFGLKLEL